MGGLANFAGALGGAVVQTTNRWIDEESWRNRQQALEDMKRLTAKNVREDDAEFSDKRAPVERARKVADAKAAAETADEIEMSRLGNTRLIDAREGAEDRKATAETNRRKRSLMDLGPVEAANEGAKTTARETAQTAAMRDRLPLEVQRAAATAEAHARATAKYREKPPGVEERVASIEAVLGRELTEQEKLGALGLSKGARDPELDTITTKRTSIDKDGNVTETTEKNVRRPGAGGKAEEADPIKAAMDAAREKAAASKPAAAAKPTAKPAGMLQMAEPDSRPELSGIDKGIYAAMQPLVDQYQQARAQLQAAAKSGDPQSIQRYTQAVNQLSMQLRQQADEQLGNGAQRFLSSVL